MFEEYPWPGNVRELRNTIEGAFNVAQGKCIHARDLTGYIVQQCGQHEKDSLPCSTGADEGPSGLNDQIHSVEKRIIEDAAEKNLYICRGCTTNRYFSTGFYVQNEEI